MSYLSHCRQVTRQTSLVPTHRAGGMEDLEKLKLVPRNWYECSTRQPTPSPSLPLFFIIYINMVVAKPN